MPKFVLTVLWLLLTLPPPADAQGETTSAIVGSVIDPAEAAIPDATVTMTSAETGLKRSVKTDHAGRWRLAQLKPGLYSVEVEAQGFAPQRSNSVAAGLGQRQTVDFKLSVAAANLSVMVTDAAPLVNTENPNTSTTLTARSLENLPNPGGDMTYPLQFAAGALINTAGSGNDFVGGTNGYGNVQFNGLPSLANGYIVDGLETNDPLTNLNSGLSTNLVLGLNSIAEVTVNTLSYAADQGRYGASQVNYVTKSGTNQLHGNLYELWNGSKFNAADFFTNATAGNHQPRSTVNHFGGSLGGPVIHDKLFFFFDSEWVRIALPIVTATTVPTPQFESYVLQQLPRGGVDTVTGSTYSPAPQLVPFYQKLFSLYGNTAGTPLALLGCPFTSGGITASGNPPNGNGCANRQSVSHSSDDKEQVEPLASITISTKETPPGCGFKPTPGSRPRIPIPSIRSSTPSRRSPSTRPPSATRMCFPRTWSITSTRRSPGMRACSAPAICKRRWTPFLSCCKATRSPPSGASITPGFKDGAPRVSSSMTISPGPSGHTSSASGPMRGSCG